MARARSSPTESGVRRAARQTVRFPVELRRQAAQLGVVPRLVAESPEEWRLGPATVAVDRRRGVAQIRYAREAMVRTRCDAAEVLAGWRRVLDKLAGESLSPDLLLPALATAYAALLAGGRPGERVPLPDLVAPVGRAAGRRTYSRAQFAWDIARLRRERRLQQDGRRVLLDVATGPGASNRRRGVWIEDDSGAGQYYGHFRLVAR